MGKPKSGSDLPPASSLTGSAQPLRQATSAGITPAVPIDVVPSVFTEQDREKVSSAYGISLNDIRVPEAGDRPNQSSAGHMAWTKTHCKCGTIPPLSTPFRNTLVKFGLAPI